MNKTPQTSQSQSQAEVEEVEKNEKVKTEKAKNDEPVIYSTVRPTNVLFNMLCKGEIIYGYFSDKRQAIHFSVPARLVKAFEQHHHVRSGFIVPLSKLPTNLR